MMPHALKITLGIARRRRLTSLSIKGKGIVTFNITRLLSSKRETVPSSAIKLFEDFQGRHSKKINELAKKLEKRIIALSQPTEYVGDVCGNFEYFQIRKSDQNQPIVCRRNISNPEVERKIETVLDLNDIFLWWPFHFTLLQLRPSTNHHFIAFSTEMQDENNLTTVLLIKSIARNVVCRVEIPSEIYGIPMDFEWSSSQSSPTLYLSTSEDGLRPSKIYRLHINEKEFFGTMKTSALAPRGRSVRISSGDMTLVLEDKDPVNFLSIGTSKDGCFMLFHSQSKTSTEAYFLDALVDTGTPTYFRPRVSGVRYFLEHGDDAFFVASNINNKTGSLDIYKTSTSRLGVGSECQFSSWDKVWPGLNSGKYSSEGEGKEGYKEESVSGTSGEEVLEDWDLFHGRLLVYGRTGTGAPGVWLLHDSVESSGEKGKDVGKIGELAVVSSDRGKELSSANKNILLQLRNVFQSDRVDKSDSVVSHDLNCMESLLWGFQISPSSNGFYYGNGRGARFSLSGLACPDIECSIDLDTGKLSLLSNDDCIRSLHKEVTVKRIYAEAKDRCKIPITIFQSSQNKRINNVQNSPEDNPGPLLLCVYGSYGVPYPMRYRSELEMLLSRGWKVAVAHVRGGGELGPRWHMQGKLMNKKNSFKDYVVCAEHLVNEGYTTPSQLCGEGHSAGGMVIGVAANERPDLFAAFIMRNPFLDPLGALLDPSQSLSRHEFHEWGDAADSAVIEYVRSYSPLSNIPPDQQPTQSPAFLIHVGLNDLRVPPRESMEWVRKVSDSRSHWKDNDHKRRPVFIHVDEISGHEGPRSVVEQCMEGGIDVAFLESIVQAR